MSDSSGIDIAHLSEHPDAVALTASWAYDEWGHLLPDRTLADLVEEFGRRAVPGQMPETWVAVETDQVVGTASLVKYDLSTRTDLSPWLAAVYVDADHRGRGLGSVIVRAVMDEAANRGIERLYLITHDRMSFYARLGWTTMERVHYRGEDVTIMFYDASSSSDSSSELSSSGSVD